MRRVWRWMVETVARERLEENSLAAWVLSLIVVICCLCVIAAAGVAAYMVVYWVHSAWTGGQWLELGVPAAILLLASMVHWASKPAAERIRRASY